MRPIRVSFTFLFWIYGSGVFIFLFCQSSIVGNLFLIVQGLQSMNLLKAVILGRTG